MKDERTAELDMRCKIHRMEDRLLRSRNPYEQEELQNILRTWRMQLQKLQFSKRGLGY